MSKPTNEPPGRNNTYTYIRVNSTTRKTTCSSLTLEDALIAMPFAVVVACFVVASCHLINEHAACRYAMSENENEN